MCLIKHISSILIPVLFIPFILFSQNKSVEFPYKGGILPVFEEKLNIPLNDSLFLICIPVYDSVRFKCYDKNLKEIYSTLILKNYYKLPQIVYSSSEKRFIVFESIPEKNKVLSLAHVYSSIDGKLIKSDYVNKGNEDYRTLTFSSENGKYFGTYSIRSKKENTLTFSVYDYSLSKLCSKEITLNENDFIRSIFITSEGKVIVCISDIEDRVRIERFDPEGVKLKDINPAFHIPEDQNVFSNNFFLLSNSELIFSRVRSTKKAVAGIDLFKIDLNSGSASLFSTVPFDEGVCRQLYAGITEQDYIYNDYWKTSRFKAPESVAKFVVTDIKTDGNHMYIIAEDEDYKASDDLYESNDMIICAVDKSGKNLWKSVIVRKTKNATIMGDAFNRSLTQIRNGWMTILTQEMDKENHNYVFTRDVDLKSGKISLPEKIIPSKHLYFRSFSSWLNKNKFIIFRKDNDRTSKKFILESVDFN